MGGIRLNLAVVAAVVIILALLAAVYLSVGVMILRELKYARDKCQKHTKELDQLEFAHGDIVRAIGIIEEAIAGYGADSFRERKLAEMQKALEKNRRKTQEAQERLEECQLEVAHGEEILQKWKKFAWLRNR